MIATTKALVTQLDNIRDMIRSFKTYNTPRPIVAQRDSLSDSFIFSFQIMVAGKIASAKSEKQITAGSS